MQKDRERRFDRDDSRSRIRITDIKIEKYFVPLKEPLHIAYCEINSSASWLVQITTEDGLRGIGSASPAAFVTGETSDTCYLVLKMLAEALIGQDATDIAGIHALMDRLIFANGTAKCALDIALHDLAGKRAGLPLYRLLGGNCPVVQNDLTISIDTVEKMARAAESSVFEKGFRILKVKVGKDLDHDIRALTAIRERVGGDIRIRVDANQGYTPETAMEALRAFDAIGVAAAEQMLPWWDLEGAAALRSRNDTRVKLMLDEAVHNVYDARRGMNMGCADFYNIKLMKCGGLYQGCMIADLAQEYGVGCMVGCMEENKVSLTAGISLVAAKQAVVEADCDSFLFFENEDDGIKGGFTREGGTFTLLEKPGLGIEMEL